MLNIIVLALVLVWIVFICNFLLLQMAVSTLMNSKMLIFSFKFANMSLRRLSPLFPRASVPALNQVKHGSHQPRPWNNGILFCISALSLRLPRFCGLFTSLINSCTEHLWGTEESYSRGFFEKQLSAVKSQDCLYLYGLVPNNFKHTERINSNIELYVGFAVVQHNVNERTMMENRLHFIKSRSLEKTGIESNW